MKDELLSFPSAFPIKVMGRAAPDFAEVVTRLIEERAGPLPPSAVSIRDSRDGNFLAVTVTFTATSRAQLDEIYETLSSHDRVLVVL